jgi:hypothetical protein
MKISSLLIGVFWTYLIVDAYRQGVAMPETAAVLTLPTIPAIVFYTCLGLSFAFALSFTFSTRTRLVENLPLVTRFVDKKFGEGTYRDFNHRLRPIALSIISGSLLGGFGLHAVHTSTKSLLGYLLCGIFLAVTAGLLSAQLLSLRYPPTLR